MAQAGTQLQPEVETSPTAWGAAAAWVLASVYFFYQYSLRSAPSVMMPQLANGFGISALAVASILGLFYYGYAPFSLVAGIALDRVGLRKTLPLAASIVGVGGVLFGTGNSHVAGIGRLLQGMGGAFAPVGAIYIATRYFPPSKSATLIGATQMFGMAGGAAGQFAVAPIIGQGLAWDRFWVGMGIASLIIGAFLLVTLPRQSASGQGGNWLAGAMTALVTVFKNPQSILCGLIAGLLFVPTTIFDMVWGVRYLQEGHGFGYASAVMRSAMVPLGWIIGCPLLGFISDRLGRRKPVILAGSAVLLMCLGWILYGRSGTFPRYTLGLAAGVASGAAMLPYTVIREANPPHLAGTATGVINFLNFTFSALLGPVFGWTLRRVSGGAAAMGLQHYQTAFAPLLFGVAVAMLLVLLLKETGPGARRTSFAAGLKSGRAV